MDVAHARIKLQVWEWIPDTVNTVAHVVVYDPATIQPVYQGHTNSNGFVEFDIDPGMYVIWVFGHNPVGYRPFLSDTWIPIAVLPGETKEVCAALVSLIDIPVLYTKAQSGFVWEPKSFADLMKAHSNAMQQECFKTAIKQREVFIKMHPDIKIGKVVKLDKKVIVAEDLLKQRGVWAENLIKEATGQGTEALKLAEDAKKIHIEGFKKRIA